MKRILSDEDIVKLARYLAAAYWALEMECTPAAALKKYVSKRPGRYWKDLAVNLHKDILLKTATYQSFQ